MSFGEDEYVKSTKKKDPLTAFLPVMGLVLVVAFAAIAYALHKPAHEFLQNRIDGFPTEPEVGYVIGGAIFLILVLFAGMFYAMFAPKGPKITTEKELLREKEERQREELTRKKRRAELRKQAAKERREREKNM